VVKMRWAEPSSRFMVLFEAAGDRVAEGGHSEGRGRAVACQCWDEIQGMMERAVKRGLARRKAEPVSQIGVDEKAFRKGHSDLTLVMIWRVGGCSTRRKNASRAAGTNSGRPWPGADQQHRSRRHGHVGPVHRFGTGAGAGGG
jgi:hypothetical protein